MSDGHNIGGYRQLAASVILQALDDLERYQLEGTVHAPKLVEGMVKMRAMSSEHAIEDIGWFLSNNTPFHQILNLSTDRARNVYNRYCGV